MTSESPKEAARLAVMMLAERFRSKAGELVGANSSYGETQARTDFITPLLEALVRRVIHSE